MTQTAGKRLERQVGPRPLDRFDKANEAGLLGVHLIAQRDRRETEQIGVRWKEVLDHHDRVASSMRVPQARDIRVRGGSGVPASAAPGDADGAWPLLVPLTRGRPELEGGAPVLGEP